MEGWGSYTLPTGTEYLGELRDGAFHGRGALLFPGGGTFRAVWHRGVPAEVRRAVPGVAARELPALTGHPGTCLAGEVHFCRRPRIRG